MDDGKPLQPDLDTIELPELQKTEALNGQAIPVGTAEQFAKATFNKPLEKALALKQLVLAIEKFAPAAGKQYRLVWRGRGRRWLAAEDVAKYRTRNRAIAAGIELATATGAHFDE